MVETKSICQFELNNAAKENDAGERKQLYNHLTGTASSKPQLLEEFQKKQKEHEMTGNFSAKAQFNGEGGSQHYYS